MEEYKKMVELLRLHGQEHLLAFYDQLTNRQKQQLLDGINGLDFSAISHWIENYVRTNSDVGIPDHFEPYLNLSATSKVYPEFASPVKDKSKEKLA